MRIIFLGTNGWYCSPTGNTPSILIDSESCYVVLDAGEGIYKLDSYITANKPIYLFLSHFHLEHIVGLHILDKFSFRQTVHIYGQPGTKKLLNFLIAPPFTMALKELPFKVRIYELREGRHDKPLPLLCRFLAHKDPVFGYRFELEKKAIAYCTDTGVCEGLFELGRGADILITECGLKAGEESAKWPHLNPESAAQVAKQAGAKQLLLTHFGAAIYKSAKERKEAEKIAKVIFKNTIAAFDGLELEYR